MPQYIDKSTLVEEIERRKQDAINNCGGFKSMREHECDSCIVGQYEEMEEILNTFEVKEVKFEKEVEKYLLTNAAFLIGGDSKLVVHHIAEHFFELGLKSQKGD